VDADLGARIAAGIGLDGSGNGSTGPSPTVTERPGQPSEQGAAVEGAAEPARG
jgi:hypothetical protein